MITGISHFAAAAAAWIAALSFIRLKPLEILLYALPAALGVTALRGFGIGGEAALFLVTALLVWLRKKEKPGDAVAAFFLAQGANALLVSCGKLSVLFSILFLCLAVKLAKRFPGSGWREDDMDVVEEPERIGLKPAHDYLLLGGVSLILTAGEWLLAPEGWAEILCLGIGGSALFWFGIFLVFLMHAYEKERTAVMAERQHRREMLNFMNVIRSQRHDYNFHVQTIAGLISQGKMEECREYVDALEQDAAAMNAVLPVKDPAVSALIYTFQVLAAKEGIAIHIDIRNDLAQIATNVYETNKIISNLVQNAIDETMTHQDKSYGIRLCVLKRGEYCVIRVSNELGKDFPAKEELERIYRQGYTTKSGHDGVGLSSIRLLAARYRGTVYAQIEGNVIHFIAKIPMNYAKETGEVADYG